MNLILSTCRYKMEIEAEAWQHLLGRYNGFGDNVSSIAEETINANIETWH